MPLTNEGLKALKPKEKQYSVSDDKFAGLSVRISPGGTKSWQYRYRTRTGRQRRISIGTYPAISLKDARLQAQQLAAKAQRGEDPAMDRRQERYQEKFKDYRYVEDLWNAFLDELETGKINRKSLPYEKSVWKTHISPVIGKQYLSDLSKPRLYKLLKDIEKTAPNSANRAHTILQALFKLGIKLGAMEHNPLLGISRTYKETARQRVLSEQEIKILWTGLDDVRNVSLPVKIAIRILLLTGQRRAEVAEIPKYEIDADKRIWTIALDRLKNEKSTNASDHVVPIADWTFQYVEQAWELSGDSPFLFPSTHNKEKSISPGALSKAFRRVCSQLELDGIRLHDLRRTVDTMLCSDNLGYSRFDAALVLNHRSVYAKGVANIYDVNDYTDRKRRMLSAWESWLEIQLSNISENKVVRFPHD